MHTPKPKSVPIRCASGHNIKEYWYGALSLYKFDVKEKLYKAQEQRSFFLCADQCPAKCKARIETGLCVFTDNDSNVQHEH